MIFREKTYSVLIASADEKLNTALQSAMAPGEYWPLSFAKNGAEARRLAAERSFDLILVNDPLPGGPALQLAREFSADSAACVAVLTPREIAEEVFFQAVESGVFTIAKPLPMAAFVQDLRLLCAARERLALSETKQQTVETRMAQIRLVNRAKWALINSCHMTEEDAHRYIQKQAMDRCISKRETAENILKIYG